MTTEERLQRIREKCTELLAIAEKRTPGKWILSEPSKDDLPDLPCRRVEWALSALETMSSATGCDLEEALPDLLCNLQHLCDRRPGWDFEQALRMARTSYAEETAGEKDLGSGVCARCGASGKIDHISDEEGALCLDCVAEDLAH